MARKHLAGTSCTAFAAIGKQLGIRDASVLPFLAWIAHRIILQEPEILHENSTRFPVVILECFLGHLYMIDSTNLDAEAYGGAVRRERKLTKLHHKIKVLLIETPFSRFNMRFHRICSMSWREYYCLHLMADDKSQVAESLMVFCFVVCLFVCLFVWVDLPVCCGSLKNTFFGTHTSLTQGRQGCFSFIPNTIGFLKLPKNKH